MHHSPTVPISNVKLKRVSKVYHMLYNDRAGKNTMSKCQRTEQFMRKVLTLIYYNHMTTYNQIDWKFPRVIVIHLYIIVNSKYEEVLCQPICQGIRLRSDCNVHQECLYEKYLSQNIPLHTSRLHTILYNSTQPYDSTHVECFWASLSSVEDDIVQDKLWHSSLLHQRTLDTSSSTSTYSIKSDHFTLGWNKKSQLN